MTVCPELQRYTDQVKPHRKRLCVRVATKELQALRGSGMLTRYALLGPVAFVLVEFGEDGTAGTGLDQPCVTEHHGMVTDGWFAVQHADGRTETFRAGDAFYVPSGPPTHAFTSSPKAIVGGFAEILAPVDTSTAGLAAQGYSVAERAGTPPLPPTSVNLAGTVQPFRRAGAVTVEGSRMGDWLFMRSDLGPRSGYTSGPCDLTHWGLVLDGEILISADGTADLVTRGDVYFASPGHRFTSPDGATIADYTPIADIGQGRVAAWRRSAIERFEATIAPREIAAPSETASFVVSGRDAFPTRPRMVLDPA